MKFHEKARLIAAQQPTTQQIRAFNQWTSSLDYRQLRQAEAPLNATFEDGRRVRGVSLTPTLCIARDGLLYDVSTPVAQCVAPTHVLQTYTLEEVQLMFKSAVEVANVRRLLAHP